MSQPYVDLLKVDWNAKGRDLLLLQSANIMRKYAKKYCNQNHLVKSDSEGFLDCEWFHAAWQYLVVLEGTKVPDSLSDFYLRFFAGSSDISVRKILISGTADYCILDHLVRTIPKNLLDSVNISILDICRTPLEICKWYSRWYEDNFNIHLNLQYNQKNVLNTEYPNNSFDMITTYTFLPFFDENEQKKLVSEWHRILKPGGCCITSVRISPEFGTGKIVECDIQEFTSRLMNNIDKKCPSLRRMKKNINDYAEKFVKNLANYDYSIPSNKYLINLFDKFNCTIKTGFFPGEFTPNLEQFALLMAVKK